MSCGPGDTNTPAMLNNAAPRPAIPAHPEIGQCHHGAVAEVGRDTALDALDTAYHQVTEVVSGYGMYSCAIWNGAMSAERGVYVVSGKAGKPSD